MFDARPILLAALAAATLTPSVVPAKDNPHGAEVNRKYDVVGCRAAHKAHEAALKKEAEEHCRKEHGSALARFEYKPANCDFGTQGKPPTYAVGRIRFECAK